MANEIGNEAHAPIKAATPSPPSPVNTTTAQIALKITAAMTMVRDQRATNFPNGVSIPPQILTKRGRKRVDRSHIAAGTSVPRHILQVGKRLATAGTSRQTPAGSGMCGRETLSVMRNIGTLLLIAFAGCGAARADSVHVLTGSLGGTSDFVFRGLSLTRGKPAVQGSLDLEFPKEFYVGAFAATADPNHGPSPGCEIDLWAGRYWRVSENLSADLRLSCASTISQATTPDNTSRHRNTSDRVDAIASLCAGAIPSDWP